MRRSNLDIIAEILYVAKDGARKTRIVYQCNLNFKIIKKYLGCLLDLDFLYFESPHYFSTEKGETYLSRYEALARTYSPFF